MKAIPPIKSVMTPFPHWIDIDEPLTRAREMMTRQSLRHLAVMEGGKLVSVLGKHDLERPGRKDRVRDVCRKGVYVVGLSEPLDRVLLQMGEEHLDCALVVKDRKLAGIFTVTDLCRCFGKLLRSLFPPGGDDRAA